MKNSQQASQPTSDIVDVLHRSSLDRLREHLETSAFTTGLSLLENESPVIVSCLDSKGEPGCPLVKPVLTSRGLSWAINSLPSREVLLLDEDHMKQYASEFLISARSK